MIICLRYIANGFNIKSLNNQTEGGVVAQSMERRICDWKVDGSNPPADHHMDMWVEKLPTFSLRDASTLIFAPLWAFEQKTLPSTHPPTHLPIQAP